MVHFLAPTLIGTGLGYTPVKICPLILSVFDILPLLEIDLHIRNSLYPPLLTIISSINGDLNMLHGLELLIPISGK